jgi:hypothetical protein
MCPKSAEVGSDITAREGACSAVDGASATLATAAPAVITPAISAGVAPIALTPPASTVLAPAAVTPTALRDPAVVAVGAVAVKLVGIGRINLRGHGHWVCRDR